MLGKSRREFQGIGKGRGEEKKVKSEGVKYDAGVRMN